MHHTGVINFISVSLILKRKVNFLINIIISDSYRDKDTPVVV